LDNQCRAAFADLPGAGLVGSINAVGGFLQQVFQEGVGWLEEGGSEKHFELLDGIAGRSPSGKLRHQRFDLGFLGEEEVGGRLFF
jgi:hypothetical protein